MVTFLNNDPRALDSCAYFHNPLSEQWKRRKRGKEARQLLGACPTAGENESLTLSLPTAGIIIFWQHRNWQLCSHKAVLSRGQAGKQASKQTNHPKEKSWCEGTASPSLAGFSVSREAGHLWETPPLTSQTGDDVGRQRGCQLPTLAWGRSGPQQGMKPITNNLSKDSHCSSQSHFPQTLGSQWMCPKY